MITRKKIYKILVVALLLFASFATACSEEFHNGTPSVQHPEGMVPLHLKLGRMYSSVRSRDEINKDLEHKQPKFLPNGSTLRLIILNNQPDKELTKGEIIGEYTYVIQTDDFGNPYPHPCQVDKDGKLIEGSVSKEPYYLTAPPSPTTYYCMAISPAKMLGTNNQDDGIPINNNDIVGVKVCNQEELLATNNHWTQTKYASFEVSNDVSKEAIAVLNPLMYTTARLTFTIKNGAHVTNLRPGKPFIEIDRVPTNPGEDWYDEKYFWEDHDGHDKEIHKHTRPEFNLTIGDSISTEVGNNILYNRMYVNDYTQGEPMAAATTAAENKIEIYTQTTVLPMHARPTPAIIRLNLEVNFTPMQFQYQTNEVFRPGHTYDYEAEISLSEDKIYVVSWQDRQWITDLDPQ